MISYHITWFHIHITWFHITLYDFITHYMISYHITWFHITLPSFTLYNPHPLFTTQIYGEKVDIYYPVYNPHSYFTATGDRISAVRAWPNTNVTWHKLPFIPGYHIYTLFVCHICMYTGIYFWVADTTMNSGCDVFIFMGRLKVILTLYTLSANCLNENTNW